LISAFGLPPQPQLNFTKKLVDIECEMLMLQYAVNMRYGRDLVMSELGVGIDELRKELK
jgi:hypothetical protein